ncbi:MAG: GNAT family N-acetyltransferase [Turicibacter sp.]|nr:GNAT family N-acetyltransferase [Turicibacter sp.]
MIKPLEKKDLPVWAQMCVDVYPDTTIEEMLSDYERGRFPDDYCHVIDGSITGFISLSVRHDYVNGTESSPVGYIEGIYVKNEYRKCGIARELIAFAKGWSREKGCREMASDCLLDNDDSLAFHTSVGFEEKERIICFAMTL